LANIAVAVTEALARRKEGGTPGRTMPRVIASGDGWSVADVVCTSGPQDRPFEERHTRFTIAIVLAGTFRYRSSFGREVMTPGSLMLGNEGHCFECGHEHGEGDRCVSFWYTPEYFQQLAADVGARGRRVHFTVPRVPPLRALSPLVARVGAGTLDAVGVPWDELALGLAARSIELATGVPSERARTPLNAEARIARTVREVDRHPDDDLTLGRLARLAGLSPYHFLRTFERVTGLTPHQYVLRTRLRLAATRLLAEQARVLDIALDCGFGDVSNFNRAFRTEFGVSPRVLRRTPRDWPSRNLARGAEQTRRTPTANRHSDANCPR
jgi:AraC family transcriptional regulator